MIKRVLMIFLFALQAHADIWPPLHRAIASGKADDAEHLIKMGADVNEREPITGMTPLMLSAWLSQRRHVVRLLLHPQIKPQLVDFTGNNALMYAASKMDQAIVSALLSTKPNLDLQNSNGESALILAAKHGDRRTVQRLISLGANPNLIDKFGHGYADYEAQKGN